MERVANPLLDRSIGRNKRLSQNLTTKDPLGAADGTVAAKDVHLDRFEVQKGKQLGDRRGKGRIIAHSQALRATVSRCNRTPRNSPTLASDTESLNFCRFRMLHC